MVIESPLSHVVLLKINDLSKYRLSPSVRVIIRRDLDKIFVIEDYSSRVFEFKYSSCLENFFRKIEKNSLSKSEITKILKSCYNKESTKLFLEMIKLGIIW